MAEQAGQVMVIRFDMSLFRRFLSNIDRWYRGVIQIVSAHCSRKHLDVREELIEYHLNFRMLRNEVLLIDTISCFDGPGITRDNGIKLPLAFVMS